jgi:hypothetical protein
MRRAWYKWKLYWATAKARKAKALWLATKESVQAKPEPKDSSSPFAALNICSHKRTESAYCNAIVQQRMYEKLVNPEQDIPKATARRSQ